MGLAPARGLSGSRASPRVALAGAGSQKQGFKCSGHRLSLSINVT